MNRLGLAALLGLMLIGMPARAGEDEWAQKAINIPTESWGFWGNAKTEVVKDASAPGGTLRRLTISPAPANAWDIGGYIVIYKPVHKGDVILLAFWARAARPPQGDDFVQVSGRISESSPPNTSITPETTFMIGREWKLYYASGTADKDYPVGKLGVGMILGTGDQVIDFGPAYLADFGPGYDISKLPSDN